MNRILFLIALLASGCAVDVKDAEPAAPVKIQSSGYYSIQAGEKINDYKVEIHLPDQAASIDRVDLGDKQVAIISPNSTLDTSVEPGRSYEYQVVTVKGQKLSFRVDVPKDLEVRAPYILTSPKNSYRRVFISSQGSILTEGRDVELNIEFLSAEAGARIATFANGSRAADGGFGRNAGMLNLNLMNAKGDLVIDVSGENGGKGVDGQPWERARAGEDLPVKVALNCSAAPKLGYPGENGIAGRTGGNAGPGGNSGSLAMKLGNTANLRYSIVKRVGAGAPGGKGGPGQQGGQGGLSERERQDSGHICASPHVPPRGPDGKTGPTGADGQPSAPGQDLGKICVIDSQNPVCR